MGLLDRRDFCSLLVAVDDHYLDKLVTTYPTWIACHPEILNMPHLLVYDSLQVRSTDPRFAQLSEMAERLESEKGHIEMRFPYFVNKRAPVSGVESLLDYDVTFIGEILKGKPRMFIKVLLPTLV
jgi:hypothetical protein